MHIAVHGIRAAAIAFAALPLRAEEAAQSFRDDFTTLNASRWFISDGWSNGAHQNCQWDKRALALRDGILRLSFLPTASTGTPHLCAEVQTRARYHHGTYEARIRTGRLSGLNAAFFTYIGPVDKEPHDEIDVEILTRAPEKLSINTYVGGKPANPEPVAINPAADAAFSVYSFIWEDDRVRWFVNGRQVHEMQGAAVPTHPQKIFFSHWGSDTLTEWMGPFTAPDAPVVMQVDWVAFTAPGQPCAFAESVLCTLD